MLRYLPHLAAILLLVTLSEAAILAQSGPSFAAASDLVPESAFVSPSRYTNAFFGFSLQLPESTPYRRMSIASPDSTRHFLYGVNAELVRSSFFNNPHPTLTAITIMAEEAGSTSMEKAQKFVAGQNGLKAERLEIGGKEFLKSESEEKGTEGKMRSVKFAASLDGYVLEFTIISFDAKLAAQLQHSIESMTFFDPARAKEIAGPESQPHLHLLSRIGRLSPGTIAGNTYTNDEAGFSYEFPAGWIVLDRATQQEIIEAGHQAAWGNNPAAATEHQAAEQCTRILLSATKYPKGTKTEETNPLIAVMAVDPACLPGFYFPTSASDIDGIDQATQEIVKLFTGAPIIGQGRNFTRSFEEGGHLFIELLNNSSVAIPGRQTPLPIFTSFNFTVAGNYMLAWMFESGNGTELDHMKSTRIVWNSPSTTSPAIK